MTINKPGHANPDSVSHVLAEVWELESNSEWSKKINKSLEIHGRRAAIQKILLDCFFATLIAMTLKNVCSLIYKSVISNSDSASSVHGSGWLKKAYSS